MNLDAFVICDRYELKADKLSIIGILDGLYLESLILPYPMIWAVAVLTMEQREGRKHTLTATILMPSGKTFKNYEPCTLENVHQSPGDTFRWILPFPIQNITFPVEGRYSILLNLDGHPIGSLPLFVLKGKTPTQSPTLN
jgi:hypothetical protein